MFITNPKSNIKISPCEPFRVSSIYTMWALLFEKV